MADKSISAERKNMVKHIMLWKLKDEIEDKAAADLFDFPFPEIPRAEYLAVLKDASKDISKCG
jgi:hypothetical protein